MDVNIGITTVDWIPSYQKEKGDQIFTKSPPPNPTLLAAKVALHA
jgi:hypothetical protein